MALGLETFDGTSWNSINITTEKISDFKLQIGYSHPATLEFVVNQAHHTIPTGLDPLTLVRFWDDAGSDPDTSTAYSNANPTFLGFIEDVDPGEDGQRISFTCYDVTARASALIPIMSVAWASADTDGTGAVPRLVFNASIDNDDDWVFTRTFSADAGTVISTILNDALLPLRYLGAAPAASVAYVASDLTGMDFETQEKIVFTSEGLRAGIQRVMNDWEPEWRMLFYPGTRKWRFGRLSGQPQITRTLNDFTETYPIIQARIERSLEGRHTAVKIYGPEALENTSVTVLGGGLNDVSTTLPVLDTYGAGAQVTGRDKWQIVNSAKRRMGRMLPVAVNAPSPEFRAGPNVFITYSTWTRSPVFMVRYAASSAGTDTWETVTGWTFDPVNGIIDFKGRYPYRYNANPAAGQPNIENPIDAELVYPSYIAPLSVREPVSGFEGTSYSDYGLGNELKKYDEMLAVGWLFGTPVTSVTRQAKFRVLARNILEVVKDTVHTGGMTFEGMDYEWALLFRRVNIDGVDGDGNAKTTGWESINALVTDVEYDYDKMLTTIQFSTDHSELTARDPAQIKEALKIGASFIAAHLQYFVRFRTRRSVTAFGTSIIGQDITVGGSVTPIIVDPFLGRIDAPIRS